MNNRAIKLTDTPNNQRRELAVRTLAGIPVPRSGVFRHTIRRLRLFSMRMFLIVLISCLQFHRASAQKSELSTGGSSQAAPNEAEFQDEAPGQLPRTAVKRLVAHSPDDEQNGVYILQFSPSGNFLAARTRDHVVQIYDLQTEQIISQLDGHEGFVRVMLFTSDEQIVTGASGDHENVKRWDIITGEQEMEIAGGAQFVEFSPGGELTIVDELGRRTADIESGEITDYKILDLPGEQILGVTSGSREFAVFRSSQRRHTNYTIRIVNANQQERLRLDGINARPKRVIFSTNQRLAAAVYHQSSDAFLWDLRNPERKFALKGHTDRVESISMSHDHRWLATTSWDQSVRLWDVISGQPIAILKGHAGNVCAAAFSQDGKWLASGETGSECSILIWDLQNNLFSEANEVRRQTLGDPDLLWQLLGDGEPRKALGAVDVLVERFDQQRAIIESRVGKLLNVTENSQIQAWIDQLGDQEYSKRLEALERLLEIRPVAENLLKKNLEMTDSAEVRFRIRKILDRPYKRPKIADDEWRRLLRLVHVLERTGDEPSRRMLQRISLGHQHVDVSQAASEALKRLESLIN